MNIRTDLVLETEKDVATNLSGIEKSETSIGNARLCTVKILSRQSAEILQKPIGTYCTVTFPRLDFICDCEDVISASVTALKTLVKTDINNTLVVGLGNSDITPDALGPLVCGRILATRHIDENLKQKLGLNGLKSVSCIAPNVLGKTGIESFDLVSAAARKIQPDLIIAIDALAARSPERLCRTVQLSDSGICAGSGVNNRRKELNRQTVGVPVIAVGIPTVIDANGFFKTDENMMVTPKEIDLLIEKSAQILSRAINIFLQPDIDLETIESLT